MGRAAEDGLETVRERDALTKLQPVRLRHVAENLVLGAAALLGLPDCEVALKMDVVIMEFQHGAHLVDLDPCSYLDSFTPASRPRTPQIDEPVEVETIHIDTCTARRHLRLLCRGGRLGLIFVVRQPRLAPFVLAGRTSHRRFCILDEFIEHSLWGHVEPLLPDYTPL